MKAGLRLGDARLPEERLADARLAREHKRRRPLADVTEELPDQAGLFLTSNDLLSHERLPLSRFRERLPEFAQSTGMIGVARSRRFGRTPVARPLGRGPVPREPDAGRRSPRDLRLSSLPLPKAQARPLRCGTKPRRCMPDAARGGSRYCGKSSSTHSATVRADSATVTDSVSTTETDSRGRGRRSRTAPARSAACVTGHQAVVPSVVLNRGDLSELRAPSITQPCATGPT